MTLLIRRIPLVLLCWLTLLSTTAFGQTITVTGTLTDSLSGSPVPGATVRLINQRDSSESRAGASDSRGGFSVQVPSPGGYRLLVQHIAFRDYRRRLQVKADTSLGTIILSQRPVQMEGVDVTAEVVPVEQKQDTVVMNAGAFKVNKDATTEDLVSKMPGISVDKTTVKAQGEDVKQVLLDGKQFFGDDPLVAMRNLPADMVEKVQVYDKLSDQSELTGFDDGQTTKTMNIITKANRRNGKFGKAAAGAGDDKRYETSGVLNAFSGSRRITGILMSNNTNKQNFSPQDILGSTGGANRLGGGGGFGGGRGGGGGGRGGGGMMMAQLGNFSDFVVGQQSGLNTTHSGGGNFSDEYGEATKLNGSYFLTLGDNSNDQDLHRRYFSSGTTAQTYDESNGTESKSTSHRANFRIEFPVDSMNSFIVSPRVNVQKTDNSTGIYGSNFYGDTLLSRRSSLSSSNSHGYTLASGITFRHKFDYPGRTISADVNLSGNSRTANTGLRSVASALVSPGVYGLDTTDQRGENGSDGKSISTNFAYTEPWGKNRQFLANYSISFNNNNSDKRQYDIDSLTGLYNTLNNALSTQFGNNYRTQRGGLSFRVRGENYNIAVGGSVQQAHLSSEYTLPTNRTLSKDFTSFLPSAQMQLRLSQASQLRLQFSTQTTAPSVTQLQSAVDNSNPTNLTTGNADLRQSILRNLVARFNTADVGASTNFFALLNTAITNDYIGTATWLLDVDTTLPNGVHLARGTQLTQNINLNGYQSLNSFFGYGFPIGLIKSNMNLNGGFSYTRTPGQLNGINNSSRSYGLTQGVVLGSNIGTDVDFTLSYNSTISFIRNDVKEALNTTSYRHTAGGRLSLDIWNGLILRNEINHQLYSGYGSSADQHILIYNAGIAKKLLADQSLEIAFNGYDLFNQNNRLIRNVTDSYIEDVQPQVLSRYWLLTLTYTIRNSSGPDGPPPPDGRFGPWREHDH